METSLKRSYACIATLSAPNPAADHHGHTPLLENVRVIARDQFSTRKHTGHSKHPLPTTQEKTLPMDITRWSVPKAD